MIIGTEIDLIRSITYKIRYKPILIRIEPIKLR